MKHNLFEIYVEVLVRRGGLFFYFDFIPGGDKSFPLLFL
jgi:hypothetical protein